MKEKLLSKNVLVYDKVKEDEIDAMHDYALGYMKFLDSSKTEREAVKYGIAMAEKEGYTEYHFGDKLEKGGKYYYNNRGKALYIFAVGDRDIKEGIHIMAAHIDSPRLDLKQKPLYEDHSIAYLKTHYYGGIRKYQWATIPLALHGTVCRADGSTVDISIGEGADEPVFYVSDLLPHLAKNQDSKPLGAGIEGEQLNLFSGCVPFYADVDEKVKINVLRLLNEKYDIIEDDFLSSELCAVPADKARFIGLDFGAVGSYGHDDRVCAYTELTGFFSNKEHHRTEMVILADKEEIGSEGVTGMKCRAFDDLIEEISLACGEKNSSAVRAASRCLSADVAAAFDPNFGDVYEARNTAYINKGVVLCKYTGARGKSSTSDASGEYVGWCRKLFADNDVIWQTSELGKVNQGGGGTVAMYIAEKNIDTVDVGVPVLSMHAPWEAIAVADLYMTHKAFSAFSKD